MTEADAPTLLLVGVASATLTIGASAVVSASPASEPRDDMTAHTEAEHTMDSAAVSLVVDGSAEASSPEAEAFCAAEVATEAAVESGDPEEIGSAVEAVIAAAPDDEAQAIVEAVAATFQAGGPEFEEAYAELLDYMRANCGFAELDIAASEYVFSGFPSELPAGPTIVALENVGTEVHEVTFIGFNEDVTLTADELLALPVEQQEEMATFEGVAFAFPGATGQQVLDLTPGRYVAVCVLPENADPEFIAPMEAPGAPEPEGADFGPPHYRLGMIHEFTVA